MSGGSLFLAAARRELVWLSSGVWSCQAPLAGVVQDGSALLEEALACPVDRSGSGTGRVVWMGRVIIGTDLHKRSAAIGVRDEREILLATGRFPMDKTGFADSVTPLV